MMRAALGLAVLTVASLSDGEGDSDSLSGGEGDSGPPTLRHHGPSSYRGQGDSHDQSSAGPAGRANSADPGEQPSAGPVALPFGHPVSPATLVTGLRGPQRCRIITDTRRLNTLVDPNWSSRNVSALPSFEEHARETEGWNEGLDAMRNEAIQLEEERVRQGGIAFSRADDAADATGMAPTPETLSQSAQRLRRRLLAPRGSQLVTVTPPPTPMAPPRRRSKAPPKHPAELLVGIAGLGGFWAATGSQPMKIRRQEYYKDIPTYSEATQMGFEGPRRRALKEHEWDRVVSAAAVIRETDAITAYYSAPATINPPPSEQRAAGVVGAASNETLVTQAFMFADHVDGRPPRGRPPRLPLPPLNPPPPSPSPGGGEKGGKGRGEREGEGGAPSAGPAPQAPPPAQPADETAELQAGPAAGQTAGLNPLPLAAPPAEPIVVTQPPREAYPGIWGGGLNVLMDGGNVDRPREVWVQAGMNSNGSQRLVQVNVPPGHLGWGPERPPRRRSSSPDPRRWDEGEGPDPWASPRDDAGDRKPE